MVVPVAIYLAFNAGGPGAHGWGAAMSTDTAFALGLLALAAPRGATRLRVFLLTLAVVDDLCALLVIATVYSEHVSLTALAIAIGLFGVLIGPALRAGRALGRGGRGGRRDLGRHVQVGHPPDDRRAWPSAWSRAPTRRRAATSSAPARASARSASSRRPSSRAPRSSSLTSAISANERLQYRLHPWTSYAIVPLFALANAGITFSGGLLGDAAALAGDARHRLRLRRRQAAGDRRRVVAGHAAAPSAASACRSAGRASAASARSPASASPSRCSSRASPSTGSCSRRRRSASSPARSCSALSAWGAFRLIALIPASTRARQLSGTADELLDLADDVDPEVDHLRGNPDAPVVLLEYGDYECPYCGQAEVVVRELLGTFGDDLCYVWRHLPLSDVHPRAQMAAEVGRGRRRPGPRSGRCTTC